MKHLFLIRHCKSSWSDDALSDMDRPLNPRGLQQAAVMADPLLDNGALNGHIHVSPACRSRQSIEGILSALPTDHPISGRVRISKKLYTFNHKDLLTWLRKRDSSVRRLTMIGHNPALSDLARFLTGDELNDLPTGALIHITLPVKHWKDAGKHQGKVRAVLAPADVSHLLFRRKNNESADLRTPEASVRIPATLTHSSRQLQALEPGIRAGYDPEFLHQYRIHLRRSRAIADALQAVSADHDLAQAATALRTLARPTGLPRDLDVFVDQLMAWQARSGEVAQALVKAGVMDYFQNWRRASHKALIRKLSSKGHRKASDRWQEFIRSRDMERVLRSLDSKHLQQAVNRELDNVWQLAANLSAEAPDDAFHDVRKALKHLRYLLELDPARYRPTLRALKNLQDLYGLFQDLHTQQNLMATFADSQGDVPLAAIVVDLMMKLENDKMLTREDILSHPLPTLDNPAETAASPV